MGFHNFDVNYHLVGEQVCGKPQTYEILLGRLRYKCIPEKDLRPTHQQLPVCPEKMCSGLVIAKNMSCHVGNRCLCTLNFRAA